MMFWKRFTVLSSIWGTTGGVENLATTLTRVESTSSESDWQPSKRFVFFVALDDVDAKFVGNSLNRDMESRRYVDSAGGGKALYWGDKNRNTVDARWIFDSKFDSWTIEVI